jgi:hypothetical protein
MATRSTIAIRNTDGSVTGVYCHWDGGYWHNGKILEQHYTNEEIVRELISFGNMAVLGVGIHPNPNEPHIGSDYQKNVCVFYERDCGGAVGDHAQTFPNWSDFLKENKEQYNYLFVPETGKWSVYEDYTGQYKLLSECVEEFFRNKKN